MYFFLWVYNSSIHLPDDEDSSRDGTQPPSNKKRKGKKSISWAEEDNLIKVFYFELDEEERGKNFLKYCIITFYFPIKCYIKIKILRSNEMKGLQLFAI